MKLKTQITTMQYNPKSYTSRTQPRKCLGIWALIFLGSLLLGTCGFAAATKPNIIVIFTDDQGYGDLGCYGSPNISTPNIDRMAAEGLRFTSFYAAPFCGPSRAQLMTGCYPSRVSHARNPVPNSNWGLNPNEITVAELLKGAGYATMCIGKSRSTSTSPSLCRTCRFSFPRSSPANPCAAFTATSSWNWIGAPARSSTG